jgi:hypothetical protein
MTTEEPMSDPFELARDKFSAACLTAMAHAGKPTGNVRLRDFNTVVVAIEALVAELGTALSETFVVLRDCRDGMQHQADELQRLGEIVDGLAT